MMSSTSRPTIYALSMGSNRALSARLGPVRLLASAVTMIAQVATVLAVSPTHITPPLGPSRRRFANNALLVESPLAPDAMLAQVQAIETALGRRRFRRWGARRMDIDIILWSGGRWRSRMLAIPHRAFAIRDFVLAPLCAVAPDWRDPRTRHSVRHLRARLAKAKPQEVDHRHRPL